MLTHKTDEKDKYYINLHINKTMNSFLFFFNFFFVGFQCLGKNKMTKQEFQFVN